MDIISNRTEMIFKFEKDDKISYSIGISRKKQDDTYENAYMPVRFKKDVNLENKTKIKIKSAWLDFYKIDKRVMWYIFINEFEEVKEEQNVWDSAKDIEIDSSELPFY